MLRNSFNLGRVAALLAISGSFLSAQALTGTLILKVKDVKGAPLAGSRVELKSDKLIGNRTGLTDAGGVLRVALLPPGSYKGTLVRDGYKALNVQAVVALGGVSEISAVMQPIETVGTTVEVIATASKMAKEQVGINENFASDQVLSQLPVGRTPAGIAILSPGVTVSPNNSNPVIAGSMSYENKYLVNGVDIVDNYFNTPGPLFIEDAIEETSVSTNNVSAEYGRFTGGVINSITKSGGNEFQGSLRGTYTKDAWNAVRPRQNRATISDVLSKTYTATIGGPIIKDKLWFFAAVRTVKSEANGTPLPYSGYEYISGRDEKRYELKLTYQITPDHSIFASTVDYKLDRTNVPTLLSYGVTPETLRPSRKDTQKLYVVGYRGLLGTDKTIELRTTQKKQRLAFGPALGGTAFWNAPAFDINTGYMFNNQYFGADPEDRDNGSVLGTFGWFFEAAGSHNLKIGVEQFTEKNVSANAQSPVDGGYILNTDIDYSDLNHVTYGFTPYDFDPDSPTYGTGSYLEQWKATRATFKSKYLAIYVNDDWTINKNVNLTLGLRNESYKADTDSGGTPPTFSALQPRLGLNYDPKGDGKWQFGAWYAVYMGKMNANIATVTSDTGNPSYFAYGYTGPAASGIRPSASAVGFRRSDYTTLITASLPTFNVRYRKDINPPRTVETGFSMKHAIENGYVTLSLTQRSYKDLFESFQGDNGYITDPYGQLLPWIEYGNDPEARREYRAATTTFQKRWGQLTVFGNYTFSKLTGNYESDAANSPGGTTSRGSFVLARPLAKSDGYLNDDRRHVAKFFATYQWNWGTHHLVAGTSLLYQSGSPFSLTATTASKGNIYPVTVNTYTGFYSQRGQFRFNDRTNIDFSAEYNWNFVAKAAFFAKLTVFNMLNNIQQVDWNTNGTVVSGKWTPGSSFGKPTSANNFTGNRQIQVDMGFRF